MTIRYLARHKVATFAANQARKPGVAVPALKMAPPVKLAKSKPIRKEPKRGPG